MLSCTSQEYTWFVGARRLTVRRSGLITKLLALSKTAPFKWLVLTQQGCLVEVANATERVLLERFRDLVLRCHTFTVPATMEVNNFWFAGGAKETGSDILWLIYNRFRLRHKFLRWEFPTRCCKWMSYIGYGFAENRAANFFNSVNFCFQSRCYFHCLKSRRYFQTLPYSLRLLRTSIIILFFLFRLMRRIVCHHFNQFVSQLRHTHRSQFFVSFCDRIRYI